MIRLFRAPQPTVLLFIPLISISLWLFQWSAVGVFQGEPLSPLWNFLVPAFNLFPNWLRLLMMVVLIASGAIYFNLMLNRHEVLYRSSYLPSLFYVLLSTALPVHLQVHPLHFANLLLMVILDRSYTMSRGDKMVGKIFSGGFLSSVMVLLYLPLLPFLIFYFVLLFLMRTVDFREWLIGLTGTLLPFFFLAVWWFPHELFTQYDELSSLLQGYRFSAASLLPSKQFWLMAVTGTFLLFALLKLRSNYYKNIVRTRIYQQSVIILFLITSLMTWFSGQMVTSAFLINVLPASIILSYYFSVVRQRIWLYDLLLWSWIALIVWNHLSY